MSKATLQKMRKKAVTLERSLWEKCEGKSCGFCLYWSPIKYIRYESQKLGTCNITKEKEVKMAGDCCNEWE